VRLFASDDEKAAMTAAEAAYDALLERLRRDPAALGSLADDLQAAFDAGHRKYLPRREAERTRRALIARAAEIVLADDRLTETEEASLVAALEKLGVTSEAMDEAVPGLVERLIVARVNDGRLPPLDEPHLLARPGEAVYLETVARLMKSAVIREYRAGSRGLSFRIMRGVSYRVGATRGQVVTVGTELQVADEGGLSVTDRRIVFSGSSKTLEFRYDKLVDIKLYSDGIQLGVTNRQTPSLFTLDRVDAVAATINAAVQAA
jgi:hypothetical protein